ncbi:alpha/beta hydrolase family protein [Herbihabitans rhizosphaerae]|uniref:Alpha/beta hydrolase family protein n=1 Tax=Herbihabitans rhizosphaerae TaxID=1872711 RepID=A0A4Q7KEL2_9PSEU|nr:alpha/beta fold hydrolase [Herbihabitans rhizosphaerae]RZS32380.1 alpha/beta hydrolase family protein [Herbihabitans rhizosphaerae]
MNRSGLREKFARVMAARENCDEPPIVIGHSMGGLLGQKLAAATDCAALVLLAAIPPDVLWPQVRPLPHLFPVLFAVRARCGRCG